MICLACESRECIHWKYDIQHNCDAFPDGINVVLIGGKCPGYLKVKPKQFEKINPEIEFTNKHYWGAVNTLTIKINELIDAVNELRRENK